MFDLYRLFVVQVVPLTTGYLKSASAINSRGADPNRVVTLGAGALPDSADPVCCPNFCVLNYCFDFNAVIIHFADCLIAVKAHVSRLASSGSWRIYSIFHSTKPQSSVH